jgi:pimeloyl-ACP methyl ester carboxylesterase
MPIAMIAHRFFDTGEVRLHVAEEGEGKPVVFVHGFPEGWFTWRAQMHALAEAGYRAVAPDLRGYGESDKPRGVERYKSSLIADDVAALIRSLDVGPVPIVGHDWGGPIAYRVAMDHPELVSRLVILNAPHPLQFARLLRRSWAQRRRSWYMAFFQLPILPERMLARSHTLARMLGGVLSREELDEYERAFSRPESFTAPLDWYRAAARVRDRPFKTRVIDKDVLVIWGMRDFALTPGCLEGLEEWLPRVRIERLPNAGHFVQHETRDEVSAILLRELRE